MGEPILPLWRRWPPNFAIGFLRCWWQAATSLSAPARISLPRPTPFSRRLPIPQIVVPGNHDIPLWDFARRLLLPLSRYRQYITPDLLPTFQDDGLFVMGLNTARSFTRTSGWLSSEQLSAVQQRLCALPEGLFKVIVTHHPFIPAPRDPGGDIVRRGQQALDRFEQCGVDMLLAGHLHLAYQDDVRSYHKSARRSVLSVQAGSAVSTRLRGEPNAYNWITISPDLVSVAVRAWNGAPIRRIARYPIPTDQSHLAARPPGPRRRGGCEGSGRGGGWRLEDRVSIVL